ncbi:permease [Clostridium bornimense]|uniref:permease n=1 Tax=Clostridium bornimense TaxID=1216932 RepID=UPI001C0FB165|nr:permease [Clostridium bornimense]MBU5316018.1 permease [Clostridium bornimense]
MTAIILYTLSLILLIISFLKDKKKTLTAMKTSIISFEKIMPQFLGIIIIVGIILAIIEPSTISKLIGNSSGFFGVLLSAILGSIVLMPTFVAFSTGNMLLQSNAGYPQVAALVSTLTLVGIMTISLESQYIGKKAAILRNFIAFIFSLIVAILIRKVIMFL